MHSLEKGELEKLSTPISRKDLDVKGILPTGTTTVVLGDVEYQTLPQWMHPLIPLVFYGKAVEEVEKILNSNINDINKLEAMETLSKVHALEVLKEEGYLNV